MHDDVHKIQNPYTGLFPDRNMKKSKKYAGIMWNKITQIWCKSLLFFMLPPGYHTTPFRGNSLVTILFPISITSCQLTCHSWLDVKWKMFLRWSLQSRRKHKLDFTPTQECNGSRNIRTCFRYNSKCRWLGHCKRCQLVSSQRSLHYYSTWFGLLLYLLLLGVLLVRWCCLSIRVKVLSIRE